MLGRKPETTRAKKEVEEAHNTSYTIRRPRAMKSKDKQIDAEIGKQLRKARTAKELRDPNSSKKRKAVTEQ